MKKGFQLIAFSLILMIALSIPSYGWSPHGHMAVAFAAYQRLTPQVKARVQALLRLNPEFNTWVGMLPANASAEVKRTMLFMIAATWPDRIKNNPQFRDDGTHNGNRPDGPQSSRNIGYRDRLRHRYWHFVDKPFTQDGTALQDPPVPNAEDRIALFRQVIASNAPDSLKSYDLVWLLHLVGDVHQPLHCAARFTRSQPEGDDGGNGVTICDPACNKRFHAFWDGLLGTSDSLTAAATTGRNLPAPPNNLDNISDGAVWINESFEAARDRLYVNPPIGPGVGPFRLTPAYRNASTTLAKQRAALAGARLANILNNELR